jgi:pimeloyl-ACP methyl ester carboxylesterase
MSAPEWPGVEHGYHDLPTGVRAHVAHAGPADAPPLLALHGFPQHWYAWRRVIDALAGEFHVLAMDIRGLGWSSQPADGDFRKARMVEDAVALLDVLGISRAGLVGHDWGGYVGFLAALSAPERWTGYVATGTPHPWQPVGTLLRSLPRFAYQPPIAAPFLGPRVIQRLVPKFLQVGWGDRSTYDHEAEEIFAAAYRDPERAEAASRYYRTFLVHEARSPVRGRLSVRTRLLYGARDPLGTSLARGFEKRGELSILERCGHFVPEERPAEVADAVREVCREPL